jgi:hypothetical protein
MDEQRELDWLAFRYIAGELSPQERDAFEQRLAEDQTAREAVASAMDVVQCTVAAEIELAHVAPAQSLEASFWSRGFWVALSTASCLALFVAIHGMPGPERLFRPDRTSGSASAALSELAIIWSESREDWDEPLLSPEPSQEEPLDGFSDLDVEGSGIADEGLSSDWIQHAVFTIGDRAREEGNDVQAEQEGDAPAEPGSLEVSARREPRPSLASQRKRGSSS